MTIERYEILPGYGISRILKGGWHLSDGHGGEVEKTRAIEDMAAFVEAGITSFDCADHYAGVEELIGDFRRAYPELARKIQIHTKYVPDWDALPTLTRADTVRIIETSPRTAWLPMALDVELNLAVHKVAGAAGLTALNRQALQNAFRGPLLHPLVEGAKRLFGLSPAALLHLATRPHGAITRDAGTMRAEKVGHNEYMLFHEDMPPLYADNETYLLGFVAIVEGVFAFFECTGEVDLERMSPTAIRLRSRWDD